MPEDESKKREEEDKKRAIMRWTTALAVVFLILVIGIIAWHAWTTVIRRPKITIAAATWAGFGSAFVGIHEKYFTGMDIEYLVVDDLNARHTAFSSGKADVLTTSLDLWVQELSQGIRGSPFLVTDESAGGDGIVANKAIRSESDLKGKRIAFARATPSHYLLYKVLERNRLLPTDIQPYPTEDPTIAGQAFLGGAVDAAVTWEPFLTQVRDAGRGHVLVTSKDFPKTIVDVLVASPTLSAQNDILSRFTEGWLQSVAFVAHNPREAAHIMADGFHAKADDMDGIMSGIQFAGVRSNKLFLCGPSPVASTVFRDAGAFWVAQKIITRIPQDVLSQVACRLDASFDHSADDGVK
jgi:NitT/TauT family transport system substrate-binding protein